MSIWKVIARVDEDANGKRGKYLYVTCQNKSLNPPAIKAGISGIKRPEDPYQSEDVYKKLNRYSTTLPQNWQLFAVIDIGNVANSREQLEKCEKDFFKCIEDEGGERIGSKELFKDIDKACIAKAIEQFVENYGGQNKINVSYQTIKEKTMKKQYTKKQITEAIAYWQKQLEKMDESTSKITDDEWMEAFEWFNAHGFTVASDGYGNDFEFYEPVNGKTLYHDKAGYSLYLELKAKNASRKPFDMSTLPRNQYYKRLDRYWNEYAHLFDDVQSDEVEGKDTKLAKAILGAVKALYDSHGKHSQLAFSIIDSAFNYFHNHHSGV